MVTTVEHKQPFFLVCLHLTICYLQKSNDRSTNFLLSLKAWQIVTLSLNLVLCDIQREIVRQSSPGCTVCKTNCFFIGSRTLDDGRSQLRQ